MRATDAHAEKDNIVRLERRDDIIELVTDFSEARVIVSGCKIELITNKGTLRNNIGIPLTGDVSAFENNGIKTFRLPIDYRRTPSANSTS